MKGKRNILLILLLACLPLLAPAQKKRKKKRKKDKTEQTDLSYKESRAAENQFVTGMKYYMLEDYEKALMYFRKAHSINPESPGINFQIAQLYMGFGQPGEAEPYCQKALSLNDENEYYYRLLAECYTEIANNSTEKERKSYLEKAAEVYEGLLAKFPENEDIYFELANIYLQSGNINEGIRSINEIEKKYGITEEISLEKRNIYLRVGKFDEAVEEGQKLIDAFPDVPRYKVEQAKLYFSNDKTEKAQEILEKLDAENNLTGEGKVLLSDVYWSLDQHEKSNEVLVNAFKDPFYPADQKINILVGFLSNPGRLTSDQLEESAKTIIELHPEVAKAYVAYGDYLLRQERKEEARKQYLTALSMDESLYQVWQNVIILDSDLNQQDSIVAHSEKALELFPNQGIFWYYHASAHSLLKNFEEAANAFERSKKLTRSETGLQLLLNAQLGDTYNSLNKYEKSDEAYEEALDIDPNYAHALNNYSYFLSLREDKLELAEAMCERLMRIEPNNPTYMDTYAWVLYKRGKFEQAKELLEQALRSTNDGTVIEHYGDVLFQLGQTDEAIAQWKKAKATGDHSDQLEKKINDGKLYE